GPHARVGFHAPGGKEDEVLPRIARHDGAAAGAEAAEEAGRGLPSPDVLQAAEPERTCRGRDVGRERGAVGLPTARAVAVRHHLERAFGVPAHGSTETTAVYHAPCLAGRFPARKAGSSPLRLGPTDAELLHPGLQGGPLHTQSRGGPARTS